MSARNKEGRREPKKRSRKFTSSGENREGEKKERVFIGSFVRWKSGDEEECERAQRREFEKLC